MAQSNREGIGSEVRFIGHQLFPVPTTLDRRFNAEIPIFSQTARTGGLAGWILAFILALRMEWASPSAYEGQILLLHCRAFQALRVRVRSLFWRDAMTAVAGRLCLGRSESSLD